MSIKINGFLFYTQVLALFFYCFLCGMAKRGKHIESNNTDNQSIIPKSSLSRNSAVDPAAKRLVEKMDRISIRTNSQEETTSKKRDPKSAFVARQALTVEAFRNFILKKPVSVLRPDKVDSDLAGEFLKEFEQTSSIKPLPEDEREKLRAGINKIIKNAKSRAEIALSLERFDRGRYPVPSAFEKKIDKPGKNTGNKATRLKSTKQGVVQLPVENNILQMTLAKLKDQFGVTAQLIETDAEFYSDPTYIRTVRDKVYFLSKENPEETYKVTSALIRQAEIRYGLMHASRLEKTNNNALNLLGYIEKIKAEYKATHGDESPSNYFIAQILNERKIPSPRGGDGKWQSKTVQRVLDRVKNDSSENHGQSL
jgi:hypothetical protein